MHEGAGALDSEAAPVVSFPERQYDYLYNIDYLPYLDQVHVTSVWDIFWNNRIQVSPQNEKFGGGYRQLQG